MKKLLLSTMIVGATSMAALAQTTPAPATEPAPMEAPATEPADTMTQTDPAPVAPVDGATAPADTMTADVAVPLPEGYVAAGPEFLTAEALVGATVHDANDESIGSVTDLVLGADGKVTDAIIDVGGFLGIGAKPVAISLNDVQVVREAEGDDVRLYVAMTEEGLEALPTYEG